MPSHKRASSNHQPDYLLLGEILRPHGVKGELKVRILTDYPERLAEIDAVFVGTGIDDSSPTQMAVGSFRFHQGYLLIKFKQIKDRTDAERYRGLFLMIDIEHAVPLEDGEIYLYQLIGLQVKTEDGQVLGIIDEVLETGANDVYVVKKDGEKHPLLVPAHDETILEIDLEGEQVIMNLPDGLLPSND